MYGQKNEYYWRFSGFRGVSGYRRYSSGLTEKKASFGNLSHTLLRWMCNVLIDRARPNERHGGQSSELVNM